MTKTVLIVGAGATRAAGGRSAKKSLPPLDADFFQIAKLLDRAATGRVSQHLETSLGEYANTLCCSLETATTYLYLKALDSKPNDSHHIAFLRMLDLLHLVLANNTNRLKTGPRSLMYRLLLSELERVVTPENLTVITFNYDLLLERVLDELSKHRAGAFFFPGCYRIKGLEASNVTGINGRQEFHTGDLSNQGISVLKLHGSLNWQSNHTSQNPTPSAVTSINRALYVLDAVEISRSLSWRRNHRLVHMKPIIVPPVSGKRGIMHKDIVPLWKNAANALQEAERIVIIGYSCPALDLEARILLSENLRKNDKKNVYVINPSTETAARFSDICGVDHITIYDSMDSWVRDAD
ncbi:MAG: hypothetical protein R3C58_11580 [Parvularculaceae bacterium]